MEQQEDIGSHILEITKEGICQYWNGLTEAQYNEQMLNIQEVRDAKRTILCFLLNAAATVYNLQERGYDLAKIMPVEESIFSWLMVAMPETVQGIASIDKYDMPIGDPEG